MKPNPNALDAAFRIQDHHGLYRELPSPRGMAEIIDACYAPAHARTSAVMTTALNHKNEALDRWQTLYQGLMRKWLKMHEDIDDGKWLWHEKANRARHFQTILGLLFGFVVGIIVGCITAGFLTQVVH